MVDVVQRDGYEERVLSAGEGHQVSLGPGESLTNVLFDITADDAEVQVVTSGDGWLIEDVGVRGSKDTGNVNEDGQFSNVIRPEGSGTIRRVYLGDGQTHDRKRAGAIGTPSTHSGHLVIEKCYVAKWADNGIYTANATNGTVHVKDCYLHDNNVASLRVAADGSLVEGCVMHNTGQTPELPGGAVDAKGVYTGYGDPSFTVDVVGCHVDCRADNNGGEPFWSHSDESTIAVSDTQFLGDPLGNVVLGSGNGGSPDLSPPAGVPMTPEAAAMGDSANLHPESNSMVVVGEGEQHSISIGPGEALENVLYDCTAPRADIHIDAVASGGHSLRNVGVKGTFDRGRTTATCQDDDGFSNLLDVAATSDSGVVVLENVYMGDGVETNVQKGAIGTPTSHAGTLRARGLYIDGWSGNAWYAAGSGRLYGPGTTDGSGGNYIIDDSFFGNNNIAHLRCAGGYEPSYVRNCVFTNANEVPAHPCTSAGDSGVVNSRGIYTGYGDPSQEIIVQNCDFDIRDANTCPSPGADTFCTAGGAAISGTHGTYGELTSVIIEDSQVLGTLKGDNVSTSNVGSDPDTTPPSAAPLSAEEAASLNVGPQASFTTSVSGLTVSVDASGSSDPDGSVAAYDWQTSDGKRASGRTASFTFPSEGSYDITLTVTDSDGATASASKTVGVTRPNSAPTASFATSVSGLTVSVDASDSSDPDGDSLSYDWQTSDGQTASGAAASFTFPSGGSYDVTLTVTDSMGASATAQKSVSVSGQSGGGGPSRAAMAAFGLGLGAAAAWVSSRRN